MCLVLKDNKPKISDEDLTFYKAYYSRYEERPRTLYRNYDFNFGELNKIESPNFNTHHINPDRVLVMEGAFHLFVNKEDAYKVAKVVYGGAVCKAVIPKGTPYLEGVFEFVDYVLEDKEVHQVVTKMPSIATKAVTYLKDD